MPSCSRWSIKHFTAHPFDELCSVPLGSALPAGAPALKVPSAEQSLPHFLQRFKGPGVCQNISFISHRHCQSNYLSIIQSTFSLILALQP